MAVEGKSPVNTAIHAGMVCHPQPMAGRHERPQDLRTPEAEHPQVDRNFTLIAGVRPVYLPVKRLRLLEDHAPSTELVLLDRCGRRRSRATMPLARKGKKPANHGKTYPAEPLTADEVLAILDACGMSPAHVRLRALLALIYRTGLRISEALDLYERDIDPLAHTVTVACGKGGKRRLVGIDDWALEQQQPWLDLRPRYPHGPLYCIVEGPTRGERMSSPWVRTTLKRFAAECGIRKNVRPHQFRHSLACDLAREGVPIPHISKQLGHSNVATTSTYLAGIAPVEVVNVMVARPAPALTPDTSSKEHWNDVRE